jgi:phosphohistidine phosphatase
MKIFLIRHCEAIDYQTETVRNDEYRFITPKGRKISTTVFKKIRNEFAGLEKIYTSPLIRAVQTAEILASTLKFKFDVEVVNELSLSSTPQAIIELIKRNAIFESMAFIGHEPVLSKTVSEMTGIGELQFPFKKSGVCYIDYEPKSSKGEFKWYINPKTLVFLNENRKDESDKD